MSMNVAPHTLAWLEIDLQAFRHNVQAFDSLAGSASVGAVVKANAYGHGLLPIARAALDAGAARLCVFTFDEALQLREGGVTAPILVMGRAFPHDAERAAALEVAVSLSNPSDAPLFARAAHSAGVRLPVHVNMEGGIYRLGRPLPVALTVVDAVRAEPDLALEGFFTHFPSADSPDPAPTERSFEAFLAAAERVRAPIRHAANSATTVRFPRMALDMVRPGMSLYGPPPRVAGVELPPLDLRPVLSWRARVLQIQDVPAGEAVSYNGIWTASRDSRIGVIAAGYADGLRRSVSPGGWALVRGRRAAYAGNICMDMALVDLTDIPDAASGDVATLIGADGDESITLDEMADWMHAIPYEVCTGLSSRLLRFYAGAAEDATVLTGTPPYVPEAAG